MSAQTELKEIIEDLQSKFNYNGFRITEEESKDKITMSLYLGETKFLVDVRIQGNKADLTRKKLYGARQDGYVALLGLVAKNYMQNHILREMNK